MLVVAQKPMRRDWFGLAIILVIAAFLRLETVQYNHFLGDEAALVQLAQGIATGAGVPILGITSSVGIPNSPVSDYMIAVPFLFSSSPLVATAFVALWNVLGVALLWWLAIKIFNRGVAFIAALLYAVSPWAVWFSSKIWIQNMHSPLVLLSLILGIYGFLEGKRWAQMLFLPVFVLALQIHFATWALLPIFPVLLWLGRRHLSGLAVAVSVVLAGLLLYPFVAGILHTGTALGAGTGLLSRLPASILKPTLIPLTFQVWLSSGLGMTSVISYFTAKEMTASLPTLPWLWLPLSALTVVGLVAMWKITRRALAVLILLWIALPVLILIPSWTPVAEHYFVASIPAYCMLTGVGLFWLLARVPYPRLSQVVAGVWLGAVVVSQVIWFQGMLRYIDTTPLPEQGPPLHYLMDIRNNLSKSDNILIALDGSKVTEYTIWRPLLFGTAHCIRQATFQKDDAGLAVLPEPPFAVLTAPDQPVPMLNGLYTTGSPAQFLLRPGEGEYTVYSYDRPLAWNGPLIHNIEPSTFDNGIQLTGYGYQNDLILLRWKITTRPTQDYQYFVHLLNPTGDKVAQRDTSFYSYYFLCAGDQIITWFRLARPTEAVTLRVGMYSFGAQGFVNSAVVDAQGNRGLPWTDTPLQ